MKFTPFNKIPRLFRDIVITEKIDGTNASITIIPQSELFLSLGESICAMDKFLADYLIASVPPGPHGEAVFMFAASRNRWLKTARNGRKADDNYGFAGWVETNARALWELGPGQHFGEWWGSGIQNSYGLTKGDKRFSLFNAHRWHAGNIPQVPGLGVVPVLYDGPFRMAEVHSAIEWLRQRGSVASPGFMHPEGVIVFHTAAGNMFKVTLDNDAQPKGGAPNVG